MSSLIVLPRARIFHGHDWVYATEVKNRSGDPQPGDVVTLKDIRGKPLGSAIYNPKSQIIARRNNSACCPSTAPTRCCASGR